MNDTRDDLPEPDAPPPLDPPRFTLRTLLLAMGAVGGLLAYLQAAGPISTMVLILLVLAIVAHVAGNAIGTQLRDHQRNPVGKPPEHAPAAPRPKVVATNLSQREHLGWPMWVSVIGGMLVGGLGGAWLFMSTEVDKATWQDTLLGALAFSVLGGMVGFVIGSFCQVSYRAHRQARTGELAANSGSDVRTGSSSRNVAPNDSPSL